MNTRKIIGLTGLLAGTALLLSGCSNPTTAGGGDTGGSDSGKIIVSSANFTESEIIGNLYAEALKADGVEVETRFNIGSREAYIPALGDGSIDLIPDYTGNLLLFLDAEADTSSPEVIEEQLPAALEPEGLAMLAPADAEDKDALVVTAETAKKWNLKTLEDLAAHNDELKIGGTPEFQERAVGLPGLEKNYGIVPKEYVPIADGGGPATVKALLDGQVTAANIFTTSTSIPENGFVVLEDPKNNFPSQKVVPVINSKKLTGEVEATINAVSAELTTDELIGLNAKVSGDEKMEPQAAALEWLKAKGLV